jgi:predicted metal-dependent phosphoesterase TrpH
MRVLFDQATPLPIRAYLDQHVVSTASQQGWDTLSNGDLLATAKRGGFDVLLTTDKNMRHQQNLAGRKIAVVILGRQQWPQLRSHVQHVVDAVNAAVPGSYVEIDIPLIGVEQQPGRNPRSGS